MSLVEGETRPLQPDMRFSIEPGVDLADRELQLLG
jgi:hypothetical protein